MTNLVITSDEALRIVNRDMARWYCEMGVDRIEITLEFDGWHVNYELKDGTLNGGGPHYVNDATTGEIVTKKYYQ